jgi:protein-S-isoprenylcysteine O-methyltransferase Ste14
MANGQIVPTFVLNGIQMNKLSFLGIGPKIGMIALPLFAITLTVSLLYPGMFAFGPVPYRVMMIAGIVFLTAGVVFYAVTVRLLLEGLRNTKLMTKGTYAACQNPLYAAIILILVPGAAFLANSWLILLTSIAAYIVFRMTIHKEYEEMEKFFGEEYRSYRKRTPEFFPWIGRKG